MEHKPRTDNRRYPSYQAIEDYWQDNNIAENLCARCLEPRRTERAHLITRCLGGLDVAWNIIPLCPSCHRNQPYFYPGDECYAKAWLWDGADQSFELATGLIRLAKLTENDLEAFDLTDYDNERIIIADELGLHGYAQKLRLDNGITGSSRPCSALDWPCIINQRMCNGTRKD